MNNTPLEDQVHDGLHRTVDRLQRTPLTVTDVRTRARRIRRRRTIASGAAVAAVLAIAVPLGLAVTGPAQRSDLPPATQTPTPTPTPTIGGTVRIDPRSAPAGHAPGVPLLDTTGPTVLVGGEVLDLPTAYDQISRYRDGWIAMRNVDGVLHVDVLDPSFGVEETTGNNSALTFSPDGSRVAHAFHNGVRWSIINSDIAGEELERPWATLPDGAGESVVSTVGFVSDDAVLASRLDQVDGTITTLLADGDDVAELPWIDVPTSASPVTGMIAGRTTVDDGRSCAAAFDGRARSPQPLWTDCERTLSEFSPDGSLVVAFPEGDQGSDGDSHEVSVLDAATGRPVVEFEVTPTRDRVVGIATQLTWEDGRTLLATYTDGGQQYVVRLGLDGSVERVAGPVTVDSGVIALRLTPGATG